MKNYFVLFIITISFISCSPSYQSILPEETQLQIPLKATKVILKSDFTADSLFAETLNLLIKENFRITNENKSIGYISTEGKKVSEVLFLRLNIKINKINDHSTLIASAESMLDAASYSLANSIWGTNLQQEWHPVFSNGYGNPNFPYEKLVEIIQKIPHDKMLFVKDE